MKLTYVKKINKKLLQSESLPSLKDDKNIGVAFGTVGNEINSTRSPSPLLDVGMIPSVDCSLCPYCGKQYRKVRDMHSFP